ncbi:uncharacterized protein Z520_05358 [Fonsecaea multimorphosa CBS 102226]|uniref:ADP-ribosylation factor n=1 Tax=Fonsecaea multimorphosa CBS 102226 TaxID=1442371 RepID=A0A0D2JZG8_9EURO|nr:uncharacterized protein Z520_05358 [Fonsecaea multimorphosa CBS 102226]KIX98897.1 hypothetical protein Z520_05358 [Fonsecaea multimorphosa CBS 102226]OAL25173.1 hypothetical protein AYO22_05050 [Fonsecaea multimorphosa]
MAQAQTPQTYEVYDLDDDAAFNVCEARLKQAGTENFIVSFDSTEAKCAVDISRDGALEWLQQPHRRSGSQALWLNFWASESQKPIIEEVAKKYDLSPRLAGLLCQAITSPGQTKSHVTSSTGSDTSRTSTSAPLHKSPRTRTTDVEKGVPLQPTAVQQQQAMDPRDLEGLTFGTVVRNLWHFCSVDFGRRYIYIGFNALYSLPKAKKDTATPHDGASAEDAGNTTSGGNKPPGQRIWSSLLICDDGTVISVFERPNPSEPHLISRRNVLNVFQCLSKQHTQDSSRDALMKVRVRWNEYSNNSTTGYDPKEAASLLFYYLFDDWEGTYRLIARLDHPYRRRLEEMQQRMFKAADVSHVKEVHEIGTQLTVLKLMYESYEWIVSRLLHSQRLVMDANSLLLSPRGTFHDQDVKLGGHQTPASHFAPYEEGFLADDSRSNVKLSFSAVARFERLLGRIRLYALTEIDECIKQKESLVLMNFNLVALKESQAVERLTRTTILLAKATILFLPVSLMTGYFSIQLPEIEKIYTLKTYWLCFLVVSILSVLFLVLFGITTHTLEGQTVYRSITSTIGSAIFSAAGKRKKKTQ